MNSIVFSRFSILCLLLLLACPLGKAVMAQQIPANYRLVYQQNFEKKKAIKQPKGFFNQ